MIDQRRFGRKEVVIHGWVEAPLRQPMPCLIHNLSIDGALIELAEAGQLPANFHLRAEAANLFVRCDVVHRQGAHFVGVVFEGRSRAAVVSKDREANPPQDDKSGTRLASNPGFRRHLQRRLT